ncbi:MAG: glycerate kinase [Bacteroidales bacterium]|nr:glycerate kinase [Bacteroidales bacterium]
MILVAPDKFKGTLSARQAANIIAEAFPPGTCVKAPMADGGEGTASIIASNWGWQVRDGYYVDRKERTAVIDSSAVIGLPKCVECRDILRASSAPLGIKVREILKGGCEKVIIGIGGTGCCDGGLGFLQGLGIDKYRTYQDKILGLSDVAVPLVPGRDVPDSKLLDTPSALMFAPQKGATALDLPLLYRRLLLVQQEYGHGRTSPFDGAGGGLGFAIASVIGAECVPGAQYVIENYDIKWDDIDFVITGEGRIDDQTLQGKVVDTVARAAAEHGVPCIAIGGTVQPGFSSPLYATIAADQFFPDMELDADTAAHRLSAAAASIRNEL